MTNVLLLAQENNTPYVRTIEERNTIVRHEKKNHKHVLPIKHDEGKKKKYVLCVQLEKKSTCSKIRFIQFRDKIYYFTTYAVEPDLHIIQI